MNRQILLRFLWFGSLAGGLGAPAPPPELAESAPDIEIQCPTLSREQTAEVESRARAELMTSGASVLRAEFDCAFDRVTVIVSSESASIVQVSALRSPDVRDALIDALGDALLRLLRASPDSQKLSLPPAAVPNEIREPAEADAPSSPPPLTLLPPPGRAPRPLPARSDAQRSSAPRTPRIWDVSGSAALEWWQQQTAAGASAELGYGGRVLSLAFRFGAFTSVPRAEAFGALELGGSLGLRYEPAWAYGVVLSAGLGASWLDITPREPYEPRGSTHVSAAFARLELSRPVRFGPWALLPAAGMRLFPAERRVNLDGRAELVLGHFAPGVALGVGRALE